MIVFVFPKRRDNNTKLLAWFVEFKGVVLHGNVKFGKVFVSRDTILHIYDDKKGYCLHTIALLRE